VTWLVCSRLSIERLYRQSRKRFAASRSKPLDTELRVHDVCNLPEAEREVDRMNSMRPRERVMKALRHEEPDRVPIDLGGNISSLHVLTCKRLSEFLGVRFEARIMDKVQQAVSPPEQVLQRFDIDFRRVLLKSGGLQGRPDLGNDQYGRPYFIDEWGIKWGKGPLYYDMIDHPLKSASVDDLEAYPWPDGHRQERYDGIEEQAEKLCENTDYAVVGQSLGASLFEHSWWMRGFENFMLDMHKRPDFANALLDKLLMIFLAFYEEYLDRIGKYVQLVQFGDDYGMQMGPIMRPQLFRRYIKPRLTRLYSYVHSRTKAMILHHSCGSIYSILDDLIEAGVDVLNPLQPSAFQMNAANIKKNFGDRLCFHGGVDIQRIMPFETPAGVRREVKRALRALAPGGGYILAGSHNLQADTPPENVVTLFDAARSYGKYPIYQA